MAGAIDRRLKATTEEDPLAVINRSLDALKEADPETQERLAPDLIRAQMMAEKVRGNPQEKPIPKKGGE